MALSLLTLAFTGCAAPAPLDVAARLAQLLPTDAILLGEQHDAPEHQQIERDVVAALALRGALSAVVIEMAPRGGSTAGLPVDATEAAVQKALHWDEGAWTWLPYAPPIMAAVHAGVLVAGGNLPRSSVRAAMADAQLDATLPPAALEAQQEAVREGHCGLLPESQIAPMARVQIARDESLAQTVAGLVVPGRTVLLLAGARHVERGAGVPLHLPAALRTKVVALRADAGDLVEEEPLQVDSAWHTPKAPPKDYCGELQHNPALPGASSLPRLRRCRVSTGSPLTSSS